MGKKETVDTITFSNSTQNCINRTSLDDIEGAEQAIRDFKYGIDVVNHHAEEAAARATDSRDMTKDLVREVSNLINVVNDVDFRKTEFELGDIVLAKNPEMKRYKRGKIVEFGTGRRIFVATMFGHLIATESDTFLIKRQPKEEGE